MPLRPTEATTRERGIAITASGVPSRGLLSGHWSKDRALPKNDFRAWLPRFGAGNLEQNLALVEMLGPLARDQGTTVAGLATAWVLSRGEDIVPFVGARRRDRYPTPAMAHLDSERRAG